MVMLWSCGDVVVVLWLCCGSDVVGVVFSW